MSRRLLVRFGPCGSNWHAALAALSLGFSAQVHAVDLTVLDKPGAVHLQSDQRGRPAKPSSLSLPLIPPAAAESRSSAGLAAPATTVPAVRMTGVIETGDADKLNKVLDEIANPRTTRADDPLTTIELSSIGGDLIEGFKIGKLFRQRRMVAVVRSSDFCLSSCALAFLGGNVHRVPPNYPTRCNVEVGGKVGFHNFFLNPYAARASAGDDPVASRLKGFADARGGAALLVRYAADIGLPPSFVASLMGLPVEQFQYIKTAGQFLSFHVCPIGLGRPSIPAPVQARNVCRNALGGTEGPSDLEASEIRAEQIKRHLLEFVQADMQSSSRPRGRLADLLANGAVMRVQAEIDKLYDDLRAAGMALPDIVGPTFAVGSSNTGKYQPVCYVSLSPDNPDVFDVVAIGRRGLSDPPHLPPENARRLFLFDPDQVINQHP